MAGRQQEAQDPGRRPVYKTSKLTGRFQLCKILEKVIYSGSGCLGWEVGQGEGLPRVTDLFIILMVTATPVYTDVKTHHIAQHVAYSMSIIMAQESC